MPCGVARRVLGIQGVWGTRAALSVAESVAVAWSDGWISNPALCIVRAVVPPVQRTPGASRGMGCGFGVA